MSKNAISSSKQDTGYYAFIHGYPNGFKIETVGAFSQEFKRRLSFHIKDIKELIKEFSLLFRTSYKCIIFDVFLAFNAVNSENIQLCYQLKEEVEKLKIPYYFISPEELIATEFLFASKYISEIGDVIYLPQDMPHVICSYGYRREPDGYVNIRQRAVFEKDLKDEKEFRAAIYGDYNPKKFIAFTRTPLSPLIKCLRKIVEPSKLLLFLDKNLTADPLLLIECCKRVLDPVNNNKYYVKPRSTQQFYASSTDKDSTKNAEIIIEWNEELPLNRKYLFSRTISQLYLTYNKGKTDPNLHFYKKCTPDVGDCHRYELNFIIDENNLPRASIKNIMIPQIERLPLILDRVMKNRHPVIGFFDNSSVICIFNEKSGKYEFLESWNGVYGKDIFLNLKPAKPVLEYKPPTNNTSIITFNELCTFTESQEVPILNNGLKLLKNSKTESILQFETSNGTTKLSTPSFLMALILKEHYMAIKNETEIRHDKMGIHFFQKFRDPTKVEEARKPDVVHAWDFTKTYQIKFELQKLLKESCNMLRVQYCEDASNALENFAFTLDDSRILVMPPIKVDNQEI